MRDFDTLKSAVPQMRSLRSLHVRTHGLDTYDDRVVDAARSLGDSGSYSFRLNDVVLQSELGAPSEEYSFEYSKIRFGLESPGDYPSWAREPDDG